MTVGLNPPSVPQALGRLERRVHDLERLLRQAVKANKPDTIFDLPGPIYESTSTGYPAPARRVYYEAVVVLGTPLVTGPGEALIQVNGDTAATLSIPAGTSGFPIPIKVTVPVNAILTVELTDAGTGGEDLTIALRT